MKWLTDLIDKIPAPIRKPLWALIVAVLVYFGARQGITIPPSVITNNDNYLVVPANGDTFLGAPPAAAGREDRLHPVLTAIARHKAAKQYAGEHEGLGIVGATKLAYAVPDADITAAMIAEGIVIKGPMVSGGPLTNLLEWVKNNPETVQAIIKIIIMLIPLFADAHEFPEVPLLPFNDIRLAQVQFPLAWARPWHPLAA